MDVIGYDIRAIESADQTAPGLRQVALDAVYADSDVVFVACELTPENHHLLSRAEFDAMLSRFYEISNLTQEGVPAEPWRAQLQQVLG